ncbi:hypothetical protein [Rhizobium tubonense]|uniref:Uncharacterized protein n=1 Tax=Rhizobium tubonense TaxID=484088 RepID=A0A2W4C9G5_9HYPH|nr:hypothetical protein [Rhizobium tubonense]PZM10029.1 hypothetical protein CPY51_23990 [Rhizobium tubonense]
MTATVDGLLPPTYESISDLCAMIWFFQHEGQSHRSKFLVEFHHGDGTAPDLLGVYLRHYDPGEKRLSFSPDGPSFSSENTVRQQIWLPGFNRTALSTVMLARLGVADFEKKVADILSTQFEERRFTNRCRWFTAGGNRTIRSLQI